MMKNRVVLSAFLAMALFWPVAAVLPRQMVFDLVNSIGIVFGFFVLWSYWPGVKASAFSDDGLNKANYLILGIGVTWVAMIARTLWLWIWRTLGEPEGGLDHILVGFIAWLVVVGGAFHLLAPRVLDGRVPRAGWQTLWCAMGAGLALGVLVASNDHIYDFLVNHFPTMMHRFNGVTFQ